MAKNSPKFESAVQADLLATFRSFGGQFDTYKLFNDFLAMCATATSNGYDKRHFDEREAVYMAAVKGYTKEQLDRFVKGFVLLREALIEHPHDYLGELFMGLNLGSKWNGQFFTPMYIARMMAKINFDDAAANIEKNGFITAMDPCTGGGAMLIAFADEMQKAGFNYPTQLYCVAQDIDIKAVYMTYIQLSWMGVGCRVNHGDTLKNEVKSSWLSPWNICYGWEPRFRQLQAQLAEAEQEKHVIKQVLKIKNPEIVTSWPSPDKVLKLEQLSLF